MEKHCEILLVDDDEDDQMIFVSVVNEINTKIYCKCVDNAIQGLHTLQEGALPKPDCIFLDLNLPLMHGFDFLHTVKNSTELKNIPIIIYSTSSREADKLKAKELGATNFLSKQTSFYELKTKLADLLSNIHCD